MTPINTVKIIPFEEKHTRDFKQLNLEWLQGFDLLEPADLKYLDHPVQSIISPGGRILVAIDGDRVVGTCAILIRGSRTCELGKLAVAKNAREQGLGRQLVTESIKLAKDMGLDIITLVSNHKLSTAIRLYESLGFEHAPLPDDMDYETADVYMELQIS